MAWRIKTVSDRTGVRPETLRAWERRHAIVAPTRSEAGYRIYSEEDVAAIARVKALVDSGLQVGEAVEQARREGMIRPAETKPPAPPELAPQPGGALSAARSALLRSMQDLDRPRADAILATQLPMSFERTLRDLLLPVAREVSLMHARRKATVAEERFAIQWVRERICAMLVQVGGGPACGPEAICAGAPGESADLALLGSALYLALRGWRVTFLGGDFPDSELGPLLSLRRPAMLLTAIVRQWPEPQRRDYLQRLRSMAPPETRVVAAGSGAHGDGKAIAGVVIARSFDDLPSAARGEG